VTGLPVLFTHSIFSHFSISVHAAFEVTGDLPEEYGNTMEPVANKKRKAGNESEFYNLIVV